jgi:hypothetical protein
MKKKTKSELVQFITWFRKQHDVVKNSSSRMNVIDDYIEYKKNKALLNIAKILKCKPKHVKNAFIVNITKEGSLYNCIFHINNKYKMMFLTEKERKASIKNIKKNISEY